VYGSTVVVANSTIAGNVAGGEGGGVVSENALTISDSMISSNTAALAAGAVSFGSPPSTITGSWFDQNIASVAGGGFMGHGGIISDSTFSANQQTDGGGFGGGAIVTMDADITITNVTISGNTAAGSLGGGGILVFTGGGTPSTNTVTVDSSTIDGNSAPAGAGLAVGANAAATSVGSTILSNNTGGTACDGTITDNGFNLLFNTTAGSCVFDAANDVTGANPELSALTLNAPATLVPTMALSATSPALDVVTTGCPPPATDARGVTRPQGDACDAGAFELEITPPPTTTTTTTPTTTTTTGAVAPADDTGVAPADAGTLPVTGGPGPGLALLGTALLALGTLLQLARRRALIRA
jgi:hypothetical protein